MCDSLRSLTAGGARLRRLRRCWPSCAGLSRVSTLFSCPGGSRFRICCAIHLSRRRALHDGVDGRDEHVEWTPKVRHG
jgi:hypothetical protein